MRQARVKPATSGKSAGRRGAIGLQCGLVPCTDAPETDMRRRSNTPGTPTPAPRLRLHFEGRSVQLIAAWTLAMGGMAASHHPTPTRGSGAGTSAAVTVAAPASALPALTARLPRR